MMGFTRRYKTAVFLFPHAYGHAGDISFTVGVHVCSSVCLCVRRIFFVRDISGVGSRRAMMFGRMLDLGG